MIEIDNYLSYHHYRATFL